MNRLLIIADDLTGACDSGAKFRKLGCNTNVIMANAKNYNFNGASVDVYSTSTDTRNLDAAISYEKVINVLSNIDSEMYLYKKIDSALRGNIIEEIKAFFDLNLVDYAIISSSFPENNRITKNGKLIIKKENEVNTYDIKERLGIDDVCFINLETIRKGVHAIKETIEQNKQAKIFVADSQTQDDLNIIASMGLQDKKCLLAGSAGLANSFGKLLFDNYQNDQAAKEVKNNGKVMLVVGTKNVVTKKQVEVLKSRSLETVIYDVEDLDGQPNILNTNSNNGILLTLNTVYDEEKNNTCSIADSCYNKKILDTLACATLKIKNMNNISTYILTGGDVAETVLESLGIDQINVVDELLPGVALSKATCADNKEINIITKSGGFGNKDTLVELLKKAEGIV